MQGINDGAGALVLASEEALVENEKLGLKPLARIVGYEAVGCKPSLMGIGPVAAIRMLLENAGLTLDKIDLFEVNEVELFPPSDRLSTILYVYSLLDIITCTFSLFTSSNTKIHE